jgi:hypothetical protein
MNKTYLSKLIEQETINVKIQLIKEHIEIARGEHIQLLENAFKADRERRCQNKQKPIRQPGQKKQQRLRNS